MIRSTDYLILLVKSDGYKSLYKFYLSKYFDKCYVGVPHFHFSYEISSYSHVLSKHLCCYDTIFQLIGTKIFISIVDADSPEYNHKSAYATNQNMTQEKILNCKPSGVR